MTWLGPIGSAGFGLVCGWLALHVAHGSRHRLRAAAFAAVLLAGGLVLILVREDGVHEAGSLAALGAGSALGVVVRLRLSREPGGRSSLP
ncbi:hypothetical protein LRS73_25775 [Methylobacterium currus]|uniref:hypothetical protein n=1 Tax=Methylobacterium currus TaxID=2051553 RepID=UPI001E557089|nr:hypothetical protein [Methylobacterium currus]UHC15856.1 hypothetical protein LRS73_25775 [Methylobacterium currus]